MSYGWRIMRAAVEQEILFLTHRDYKNYIVGMKRKGIPYQVMSKVEHDNGTVTALVRKRYNPQNAFLWQDQQHDESQPAGDRYTGEEEQQ